jgi:hypothetical protein
MGGAVLIHLFMFIYSIHIKVNKFDNLTGCDVKEELVEYWDIKLMIYSHLVCFLFEIVERYLNKFPEYGMSLKTLFITIHSSTYLSSFIYLTFKY